MTTHTEHSNQAIDSEQHVLLHYPQAGVAELILNRPEKHNAFDDAIIQKMLDKLDEAERNPQTRILVLKSNGKHFSAGADLSWMKRMAQNSHADNLQDAAKLAELMRALNHFRCPTIALIQGATYGGAVGLAACCDIVLAQDNARFCLSEVKIGLTPATISPYVIRAIGERQARRFFLTAEVMSSADALQIGLVHKVLDSFDALNDAAETMIQQLSQNSPQATKASKTLIFSVSQQDISTKLIQHTTQCIADIRVSEEGQEGLNAFLNKRRPAWVSKEK
ncbi:enoyl-CoA hydratase-related protein [Marinomonas sp. 2405UD68-3]|uniref:enoyl-CoA hydratase-related protein n=1 Tax=Marinomonas sp. 2405UD68-3 TaxID=3391835 RepID=UPI0039C8D8DB